MLVARIQSEQASNGRRKLSIIKNRHDLQHGRLEDRRAALDPACGKRIKNLYSATKRLDSIQRDNSRALDLCVQRPPASIGL